MDLRSVRIIAGKEFRDSRRNRWVGLLAGLFTVLALSLSYLGLSGLGTFGVSGFGRTAASLLNLVVLVVPLMGLLTGAVSLAGERERGTLLTLMAQPVTAGEIVLGKFLGAAAALLTALLAGFGLSGLLIARFAGWQELASYLGLVACTLPLGLAYLGLGFCLSAVARRHATALGGAVVLWLALTLLSDLGLMGTAMVLRLDPGQLFWLSLGNPVQAFRLSAMELLQGNLELLGASGLYASGTLGRWLLPVLAAVLAAWVAASVSAALALFRRRGAL